MRIVAGALALTIFAAAPVARAQIADAGTSEADALSAEIDRDAEGALSNDCALACNALDSMRRAADRLCGIDPGERCARAREKLRTTLERVFASCPECESRLRGAEA